MDLRDAITAALKSLSEIRYFKTPDGKVYPEDSNIKDILHLAETLKSEFSIDLKDYDITKDKVVDIVETVESELIRKEENKPILRERIKDESKLYEELIKLENIISRKYSLGTEEEAIMKALFMWVACLTMKKLCRKVDAYGIEPINRLEQHSFLIELSKLNPSIKKGLASSKIFRIEQVTEHPENWDYSWIPQDSPFWCADKINSTYSEEQKDEKKWLMSQIQYYIEKILEVRQEDMIEIENRGKEFSENLTRERNIITSAGAFIAATVIPILFELSGNQPHLIYLLIVVLSITGILFTLLSVVKHKILISFSIIKAAYSLPVGKLSFIRDKYIGLTIFRELRDELTSKNFENLFTYLQIIGGSKLEAIGQLQNFSGQKSIPSNVRRFLKNRVFTEQHIAQALYEFFLLNQDRLKNDLLIISLEEEYPTLMGGKSIFESWTKSNPIMTTSRYKTKLNISFLIPTTWEVIRDVKYSKKYRSYFKMRHGWYKLSEFEIFKKESVSNTQKYIDAVAKNLADDETINLTESSEFELPSDIHAHKFIYDSRDEPISSTMEVYFSYSENMYQMMYQMKFESIHKYDFLKLLPEVEEIIRSTQVKNS